MAGGGAHSASRRPRRRLCPQQSRALNLPSPLSVPSSSLSTGIRVPSREPPRPLDAARLMNAGGFWCWYSMVNETA